MIVIVKLQPIHELVVLCNGDEDQTDSGATNDQLQVRNKISAGLQMNPVVSARNLCT